MPAAADRRVDRGDAPNPHTFANWAARQAPQRAAARRSAVNPAGPSCTFAGIHIEGKVHSGSYCCSQSRFHVALRVLLWWGQESGGRPTVAAAQSGMLPPPGHRHALGPHSQLASAHMPPSRWRGAARMMSSTRKIISAASVALSSAAFFTLNAS